MTFFDWRFKPYEQHLNHPPRLRGGAASLEYDESKYYYTSSMISNSGTATRANGDVWEFQEKIRGDIDITSEKVEDYLKNTKVEEYTLVFKGAGSMSMSDFKVTMAEFQSNDDSINPFRNTSGDDKVWSTNFDDYINTTKGDDKIKGFGGNDTLIGGKGDDVLDGGDGNDKLIGKKGADTFVLSPGKDKVLGFKLAEGDVIEIDSGIKYELAAFKRDSKIIHDDGVTVVKRVSTSDLESAIEIV